MFYLQDSEGNVVRAINWSSDKLTFILRHDTKRVESTENLAQYDALKIPYTILDSVEKNVFANSSTHAIKDLKGHLTLVKTAEQVLTNIEVPSEDPKEFQFVMKRTSQVGGGLAAVLFGVSLYLQSTVKPKEELQVVQVMDRQQMEKSMIVPVAEVKQKNKKVYAARRVVAPTVQRTKSSAASSGVLGVLGSLKNSKQKGGLKLDQAEASAGIGRGGSQGSGGIQTSVYSKGMFAAPLGTGGKANGAGGYGTRGKGGGRAGYGEVSLVGAGGSFFQPVESEAWIGGGLDRNEIAAVINRHLSEVRFCYEKGLQQKPKLAGRMSMNFMISPNGTVSTAKVANSSLNHAAVEGCIRDRLKTWNFPKPEGGVTVKVSYPFILRRVSDT